jgi:hypothetical protein
MSSIDGISISISLQPSGPAASGPATRVRREAEHDGDDDDGARVRHGHGHGDSRGQGSLQSALMQALQSLGLTGSGATSTTTPTTSTAAAGTSATSTTTPAASPPAAVPGTTVSAADTLKADIRSFMHALFQAVRAAQPAAPSTSTAATSESTAAASASTGTTPVVTGSEATPAPGMSAANITININIGTQSGYGGHSRFGEHQGRRMQFAGGLGAVISQVSNNQAPTQLQDAFAKVLADLQPAAPASGTGGSATGTSVTLQALLTQLQQNLGYGAAGSASPVGNSVNSVA